MLEAFSVVLVLIALPAPLSCLPLTQYLLLQEPERTYTLTNTERREKERTGGKRDDDASMHEPTRCTWLPQSIRVNKRLFPALLGRNKISAI